MGRIWSEKYNNAGKKKSRAQVCHGAEVDLQEMLVKSPRESHSRGLRILYVVSVAHHFSGM